MIGRAQEEEKVTHKPEPRLLIRAYAGHGDIGNGLMDAINQRNCGERRSTSEEVHTEGGNTSLRLAASLARKRLPV